MVTCSSCGKPIEKVPDWLSNTRVDFVCNNCPNRTAKNIAFVSLDAEPKPKLRLDDEEDVDVEAIPDDEPEAEVDI